ncbi:MAG: GxxExxY protein [Fidelibacterota bacterium]
MKHQKITDKIISAFYNSYNHLGYGFCEKTYENALMIELRTTGLSAKNQFPIKVYYKDYIVGDYYADILVNGKVLIELKAIKQISKEHKSQLLRYLHATDIEVGLILNFSESPKFERVVYSNDRKQYAKSFAKFESINRNESIENQIITSFYNCYNALGYGFLDNVYRKALSIEFQQNGIEFEESKNLDIYYMEKVIGQLQTQFWIDNKMIFVLSRPKLRQSEKNKIYNMLKSTHTKSGMVLNFGNEAEFIKSRI